MQAQTRDYCRCPTYYVGGYLAAAFCIVAYIPAHVMVTNPSTSFERRARQWSHVLHLRNHGIRWPRQVDKEEYS
jgi:hypothetical protein